MIERNVTIPGSSTEGGISNRNPEGNNQTSRANENVSRQAINVSPRGNATHVTTARSSLASSRVSSPIGQNRGSEEKINLFGSTNAINATSSNNIRSENRVHFDLKNSDTTKSQGSLNTVRKATNLTSASSTVRRLTSQQNHLSALPLDARQRLEEMVTINGHIYWPIVLVF